MDARHLIDAIVRQTTLLIAQLATSGGVRAPLAHIADEVFLELAREIEQQGVTRNVVADMFGLALRTYQKKVNRLRASSSAAEKTLWESVLLYVRNRQGVTRSQVLAAFATEDERHVIAVLGDLVVSGLLYATGRGQHAAYSSVPTRERLALIAERGEEALAQALWLEIADTPGVTRSKLKESFPDRAALVDAALSSLLADGRVQAEDGRENDEAFRTSRLLIRPGSEAGWETSVLDHFRAVCTTIASKLQDGGAASERGHLIGGTTLAFDSHPDHPYDDEVLALLATFREQAFELWERVSRHNQQHPVPEHARRQVIFYFGQNVVDHAQGTEAVS